jgi:hypothetical protein
MTTQAALWTGAGAAALMAAIAALAEWRRGKRRDLDRVGWVPWNLIHVLSLLGMTVAAALALQA